MKKIAILFFTLILILTLQNCKSSDSESPTAPDTSNNYFPSTNGTNYKYSYSRTDSSGQTSGTRSTYYSGTEIKSGTTYKIQVDSIFLNSVLQVDRAFFRTSGSGVYYFIDTTGFAASITDPTLIPLIPFVQIDQELLGYSTPLESGKSWPVFKINLTSPVVATVIDVSAVAEGVETISLNLPSGQTTKEAFKIKYTLSLRLNPFSGDVQTYTANAWLVEGIGPAKWDGCGTLVNVFTGLGIDFADTTTVVSQSLIDYTIK
jgi:hypothetical protein